MDDYLTKPIRKDALREAIEKWTLAAAPTLPDKQPDPVVGTTASFALDEALDRASGDAELLRELVVLILEDAPRQLADLANARDRDDGADIKRLAHALRGAVSNISARPIVAALQDLEAVARGGTTEDCAAPLARAQAAWRDLERDLRAWMEAP